MLIIILSITYYIPRNTGVHGKFTGGATMLTKTDTMHTILTSKMGYRTENCYGSGVRDLVKVVEFEIFELLNLDILEYLTAEYDGMEYLDFISTEDVVNEDQLFSLKNRILRDVKTLVTEQLGDYPHSVIWLTTFKGLKMYLTEDGEDYYEYSLEGLKEGDDFMILSNLGDDGILIAFKNKPIMQHIW